MAALDLDPHGQIARRQNQHALRVKLKELEEHALASREEREFIFAWAQAPVCEHRGS